jgi:hypothetical protein
LTTCLPTEHCRAQSPPIPAKLLCAPPRTPALLRRPNTPKLTSTLASRQLLGTHVRAFSVSRTTDSSGCYRLLLSHRRPSSSLCSRLRHHVEEFGNFWYISFTGIHLFLYMVNGPMGH